MFVKKQISQKSTLEDNVINKKWGDIYSMSDFILDYDILELIVEYSKALGKRSEEYGESLDKKIIAAIENVTGGSSGNLINASNSVSEKIKVLKQKSEDFHQFAVKISSLLEVAQQTDQEVADAIAIQRDNFLGHHKPLRIENWKEKLLDLLVDFEISSSLLTVISEVLDMLPDVFKSLKGTIGDWYKSVEGRAISTGTPVGAGTVGIPGWIPAYGNEKFPVLKNGKGIGKSDLNDTILKWYEYPGIAGNGSTKNVATEKPEYTIGPATGDYVPVPDYPQLGPAAALALGFDSAATGGMVVSVMNAVNTLIGKPLITKEVIDYNKKNTYDFAERYKMAQVVGIGSVAYAMTAGATEGAIMKEVPEGSENLKPQGLIDELANSGVKYNPDDVVSIIKNSDGKLMWLENGNSKAGLQHILERHADDFVSQGVNNIPNLLEDALSTNPIKTGSNAKGLFADYSLNGNSYRVAYGTNGYIVSFYPID